MLQFSLHLGYDVVSIGTCNSEEPVNRIPVGDVAYCEWLCLFKTLSYFNAFFT